MISDETFGDYVACVVFADDLRDLLAGDVGHAGAGLKVRCEVAGDGEFPGAERTLHVQTLVDTRLHMRPELTLTVEGAITIITEPLRFPMVNSIHVLIAGTLTVEAPGAHLAFVNQAV